MKSSESSQSWVMISALFFANIAAFYIHKSVLSALVLSSVNGLSSYAGYEAIKAVVVGLIIGVIDGNLSRGFSTLLSRLYKIILCLFWALGAWYCVTGHIQSWALIILNICGSTLNGINLYCIWALTTCISSRKDSSPLSFVGLGAQVAAISVPWVISSAETARYLNFLLLAEATLYLVVAIFIVRFFRFWKLNGYIDPDAIRGANWSLHGGGIFASCRVVAITPFLRNLALFLFSLQFLSELVRWSLVRQAANSVSVVSTVQFFSANLSKTAIYALAFQCLLVPAFVKFCSSPLVLGIHSMFVVIVFNVFEHGLLERHLTLELLAIIGGFEYTVFSAMREKLFVGLPIETKKRTKAIFALAVPVLGAFLANTLIATTGGLAEAPRAVEILSFALCGAGLWALWALTSQSVELEKWQQVTDRESSAFTRNK